MRKHSCALIIIATLLTSMLALAIRIQSVKASGTIYIRANGSIDPPTAPVATADNITYTLTGNITTDSYSDGIVIQRNNTELNGVGFTLDGKKPSSSNGIYLNRISNVTLKNISIKSFHNGVYENGCSNNRIVETNLSSNDYGVYFQLSNFNTIEGNNITKNTYAGIWLELSQYNNISKNTLANTIAFNGIGGIKLQDFSNYNNIVDNYLTSNAWYGIYVENSWFNHVFHNNFVNNYDQAYCDSSGNAWDDGYEGNYWSDYDGTDSDGDGIGDTSYIIDSSDQDNYPLMSPWNPPDIAVMNLTSSKAIVGEGFPMSLNVTVENQGNKIEAFNVTAYANTTAIATSENVMLTGGNSTILTFMWNTSGFTKGNYTMSAVTDPILGETDLEDNNFTAEIVKVVIAGDVNADGYVGIDDLFTIAKHFGSETGQPNYSEICDINDDGFMGIDDLFIAGSHFGKENP
jgi:parallel beta-helix repeat protein